MMDDSTCRSLLVQGTVGQLIYSFDLADAVRS